MTLAPPARSTRLAKALSAALLATSLLLCCGKKGPPLPPLAGMQPTVTDLEVRQVGSEAVATFTLPVRPDEEEVDYVTLGVELWRREADKAAKATGAPPPGGGRPPTAGALAGSPRPAGAPATAGPKPTDFTEEGTLVASAEGEGLFEVLKSARPELRSALTAEAPADGYEFAVVLKTNQRRRGTLSNVVPLVPIPPPPVPQDLKVTAQEGAAVISWTADPSVEGLSYRVFRVVGESPFGPEPVDGGRVKQASFTDSKMSRGATFRYRVTSVTSEAPDGVESAPSSEVRLLYQDTFPPKAPEGLRVVPENYRNLNLLWNPNAERDLAGYRVYRREPGGAWTQLDVDGAPTATFTDTSVVPGATYEYAVTAYDSATPANESPRSEPSTVEVPARP